MRCSVLPPQSNFIRKATVCPLSFIPICAESVAVGMVIIMKEIRIGIIGTGIIAHRHMKMYQDIAGVEVVAACDIQRGKLDAFCDSYGISGRYENFRELLARDDIDAVDVCLHNNLHAPISIEVMASGKHCYCEKPMAGTYYDAAAMLEAAKRYGKKLHIQLSTLYSPQHKAAKKIIASGFLGKIYHARSYGYRRRGRPYVDGYGEKEFNSSYWAQHGALFDMGVYHIAQLLELMGTPKVERISGRLYQETAMDQVRQKEAGFDVEELGVGLVHFSGGLTLDILESWAIHNGPFPKSSLSGTKGGLRLDPEDKTLQPLELFCEMEGYPADIAISLSEEEYRLHQLHPEYSLMDNSQTHWIGLLRGELSEGNTAEVALQTMLVSEGIALSSALGREVTAQEVVEQSRSAAIRRQETPFGELCYEEVKRESF